MNRNNRDLLVLSKQNVLNPDKIQQEVEWINLLLNEVEVMQQFSIVNEVIDVNRCKIINAPLKVEYTIRERANKPFVFICNKN